MLTDNRRLPVKLRPNNLNDKRHIRQDVNPDGLKTVTIDPVLMITNELCSLNLKESYYLRLHRYAKQKKALEPFKEDNDLPSWVTVKS